MFDEQYVIIFLLFERSFYINMNIYQTCFDLVNTYIYGSSVQVGTYEELVCIAVSTLACLFVFALPFVLVYKIIKMI